MISFKVFLEGINPHEGVKALVSKELKAGIDVNHLWITFSDEPTINVNTKSANKVSKSTPIGLFAFPIQTYLNYLETGSSVSGVSNYVYRKYYIVFKTDKYMEIGSDLSTQHIYDSKLDRSGLPYDDVIIHSIIIPILKWTSLRDIKSSIDGSMQSAYTADFYRGLKVQLGHEDMSNESMIKILFEKLEQHLFNKSQAQLNQFKQSENYPKLSEIAQKLGLNIDYVFARYLHNGSPAIKNKNQELYEILKQTCRYYNQVTGKPWLPLFTNHLRKMNIDGVADTNYSQAIHPAEASQGVFMSTKNIKVLDIFTNPEPKYGNMISYIEPKITKSVYKLMDNYEEDIDGNNTEAKKLLGYLNSLDSFLDKHPENKYDDPYHLVELMEKIDKRNIDPKILVPLKEKILKLTK